MARIARSSSAFFPQTTTTMARIGESSMERTTCSTSPSPCPPPATSTMGVRLSPVAKGAGELMQNLGSIGMPVASTRAGSIPPAMAVVRAAVLATQVRSQPRWSHTECGCSSVTTVTSEARRSPRWRMRPSTAVVMKCVDTTTSADVNAGCSRKRRRIRSSLRSSNDPSGRRSRRGTSVRS